ELLMRRRLASLLAAFACAVALLATPTPSRAELMTFHLTVGEILASVGRTNAFLVSLGRQARGVKLVPGGTKFAGLTCAGFGDVYKLASITVLTGPSVFPERVTTKKGKDGIALATAFGLAGSTPWSP